MHYKTISQQIDKAGIRYTVYKSHTNNKMTKNVMSLKMALTVIK